MSSKKFVYLLMVAIVFGFMTSGAVYGQSTGALTFKGKVLNADGTPAPGYTISGETVPVNAAFTFIANPSRTDGSYSLAVLGFSIGGPPLKINVGDRIKITATDADGNDTSVIHTVTVDNVASGIVDPLNIDLSGLTVQADPPSIPADGSTTSTITVTVREGSEGVTGDIIMLSVDKGTVDATATEVGNGVYTATYKAPSLVLIGPETANISVSSTATELDDSVPILLTPVPTTVIVELGKLSFIADTPEMTTVTATVDRAGPVTDAAVELALNPEVGDLSEVTDNGDGTYSATYTSGSTAGDVILTATAPGVTVPGRETITINAGPPAEIALSAEPETVSSLRSSTITAVVTDSNGNAADATLTASTTSGGAVGEFASTVSGTYTATYSAPMVEIDIQMTETITVSTDGVSEDQMLNLIGEDPIDVAVLTIKGRVYKEDGEIPAGGVEITVTVGSTPQTTTTDADGYMVLFIRDLITPVATTGDIVSIAVADANVVALNVNGTEQPGSSFRLINDILEKVQADEPVTVDVTTDIVIPPRTVNALVVEGMVSKEDGTTSAGSGLDVTVTVGSDSRRATTETDGSYEVLFIGDLITSVATTGDMISVEVRDGSVVRGTNPPPPEEATLSNLELGTTGSATVRRDVKTDIGLTSSVLAVAGPVYLKNGDTDLVPASNNLREGDLKVVVTNTTRDLSRETTVGDDGTYELLFVGDNFATVAETGDEILVEVRNDAGVIVGSGSDTLTIDDIKATRADIDVETDVRARVLALVIEGNVIELDGSSAGRGVEVTLTIVMNGTPAKGEVVTDAAGGYRYLFASTSPEAPAARTDDILRVQVLRAATGYFGYREMELRSHELAYQNQPLVVLPPIQLIPPTLRLGGLSINTSYADRYYGYLSLEAIKKNPELLQLIPSGILHLDLSQNLLSELPPGFNPTPEPTDDITKMFDIDSENFGNGITPRPAWHVLAGSSLPDPGRWLNGNQLNLYVVTGPIPSVQSVTFNLTGLQSATMEMEAMPVPADGYMHNFQLEEERAILFLPSWPSLNANAPIFSGVTLMIEIDGQQTSILMTSKLVGDEVVWEAPATLTANSTVYYYYKVELDQPYPLDGEIVSSWLMPDPRNLQVKNLGIVETLLAPDVPELMEIVTTTDLKLRSVFNVPGTSEYESLWVATFDFPADADDAYSVDTAVQYDGGLVRNIPNQMFTLDRTPPTADITVAIGESAGLYEGPDGYVTAAHTDEGTLNLTAMRMAAPSESEAYLYQIIQLDDDAGNPGNHVWNPIVAAGEMLPLTYMEPHQVQMSIGDVGSYGIRAVGVDSILNISSNTMPRRLDIVPPDPDRATVTFVHADYFEMKQSVDDGVAIFSDRSNIMLTVEMIDRTDHPLKSIAVDFQINGEGDWKPIAMLTGDDIAEAASGLEVNWDRTDDFADLLDMRGQVMVRVTVTNALDVEGELTETFEIVPLTLRLGGLSIDTSHADDYYGYLSLEAIKKNPELLQLIPSGILHLDLSKNLLSELPPGFNPTLEPTDDITKMFDIDSENFGNGITPRPAWHVLAGSSPPDTGRWLNGNQLNLYVVTGPTSSIQNVTFNLTGPQSATMEAVSVPADGYMHNFQLEEERAILFLPSWPSLNANTPIFSGVTLMIEIDGQQASILMTSKLVGDEVVWEAPATLTANSTVYYYYQVELDQPYPLDDEMVSSWPMPDPRNLQVQNRGIVETLLAPDMLELKEIVTTTDLKLRSVFNVPGTSEYESLWVAAFDFPADADGAYSVDTVVQYMGGPIRSIPNQMFTLDRTPPTADITVAIGENAGLYEGPDGYVTAAHTDEGTLNLTAMPTAAPSESAAYLYQIIQLDDAGNPGNQVWNPAMVTGEMLPLTYMDPHQIQASIGDVGNYGIRAVGIDSILNISSNTMPRRLNIVPPDPDIAAVTLVHADYNGDGTTDGRFEMEQSADGATIFSDRSNVNLTVEMTKQTGHPLKSIAVDFQINGEDDWKPIAMLTGDDIAEAASGLEVNWDRTDDFADLLDIRDQAMVRVTVTNALDVEGESTATFELVPPALQLGGLSINPDYTAFQDSRLQELLGMDLGGLAAASANVGDPAGNPLVMLPPSLFLILSPLLSALGSMTLELPSGFEPADENVIQESFGNAITSRPSSWFAMAGDARDPGRWITGDQLNLYTVAGPTATGVTFTVDGSQPIAAVSVPADGDFMYTFQLEEELIALFIGNMPVFGAAQLMIDGQAPIDMVPGDMGVWSADAMLTPGSTVSYYYMIELAAPYHDPMGGFTIAKFPLVDPRNRQVKTTGLLAALDSIASSEFGLDTFSGVRSVFTVPEVYESQSLWVGRLDFAADGAYSLDVAVQYESGATDELTDKMFTVDRTPPTADVTLTPDAPGENAGMYLRDDGVYIATALPVEGAASLNLAAIPIDDSDLMVYMYELARLDAAGNPGAWNPAITADLLPLDLLKFLTNPGSVLPVTYDPPHQIQMLIRNSEGGQLMGRYGLRAVGIDSLLNMDSGRGPGVMVDIVPPDPDRTMISSVQVDFDGNGVIDEDSEMQSTAGDVVVFSDSMATLTVDVIERTMHPLTIAVEFQMPGGDWETIAMMDADISTMAGDQLMVNWAVPDLAGLPDRGGHVMVRTVTTNALSIRDESVGHHLAYQRRTAPEVSAIYTYVTERHPDSGAPQGMITVSAFTQVMTAPDAAAVQLEIRRSADADWMPLGVAQIGDSRVTSHVQIAIIEDLVNSILSGSPTAPISPLYREWFLDVDSATLEDTILDDTPAASDASLDDNPYVVRAIAVDMAGGVYRSADGITDSISLDNYSPTAITTVANEVEMVAPREDGSYYVSGLIHESVPDPMLTLTARTGAHSSTFTGGIALAVNDASGTAMEIAEIAFNAVGNYNYRAEFDLSSIPNGTYTFMAVAHAADGSPEDRIVAMAITVEVGNFTPPDNFADPSVDILSVMNTLGEANSPADIDAMYPTGFPAIDDKVTATLIVPNVSTGDVDVLIGDDGMSASAMGALMVMTMPDTNNIVIMIDTSGLDEGMYGLVGTVTKPNGSVQFGLPSIGVDRTGPAVEIVSPLSRSQLTTLPTIQVTYTDASGFDPNETDPMSVVITLTRLADDEAIDVNESLVHMTAAADGEVLTRSGDIVYTHDDPLVGGAYRVEVTVTDVLGNEATAEPVEFTVEGVQPTVSIVTPTGGQVVDPTQPLIITAALTGNGEITVTEFQLNGTDTEATVENNWLTHTVQPPLDNVFKRGAGNTVTIKIVDGEGRTAEATSNFVVALDKTPPVVATYSPQGIIRSDRPVAAATVTDESGIKMDTLTIIIAGVPGNQGSGRRSSPTSTTVTFTPSISVTPGPYTARVTVEDVHGNRTEVEWQFTVELDVTPPSITATSPHGIIRSDKPIVSVSASDDRSGVDTIDIVVKGGRGRAVEGIASTRSDRTAATFTPIVSLENGTYTVDTIVTDKRGNKAAAKWQFTVELDVTPPSITTTSPHGVIRLDRPIVSVSASDDHSGVNTIEVMVADTKNQLVNGITEVHADKTSANFTPSAPLKDGTYTVDVNVTDMRGNQASSKWQFTVELDTIPPSVTITRPAQEHTENRRPTISATYTDDLSGVDGQSIKLWLDDGPVDPDEMSITQVMFTPSSDLEFGQHTVKLEVSDTAPTPNTAVQEWSFFVERIGIANARNYPNPFEDDTTIAFRLSRQASVTVRIYDFTGRLVAEPVTNSLEEAGPVEIAWSGDTSAGENLARGVYFCHILMESELEPQSAILKMAIISE